MNGRTIHNYDTNYIIYIYIYNVNAKNKLRDTLLGGAWIWGYFGSGGLEV